MKNNEKTKRSSSDAWNILVERRNARSLLYRHELSRSGCVSHGRQKRSHGRG